MRFRLFASLLVFTAATSGAASPPLTVRVMAEAVNLRAQPSLQAETVAQAGPGDRLKVHRLGDEWVAVAPPDEVFFYVHGDFVRNGIVEVARLNVRAGPGINFSEVDTLERNNLVTVVGEFAEWLKIKPPPSASVWISRQYVEVLKPAVIPAPPVPERPAVEQPPRPVERPAPPVVVKPPPQPAADPPPPAPPVPERPAVEQQPPRPVERPTPPVVVKPPPPLDPDPAETYDPDRRLKRLPLVPLAGQGKPAVYAGVLTRGGFLLIRPSRFRVVEHGRGRVNTLAYVIGNEAQLDSLVGRELEFHGREYWLQGTRHPVLVVESILLKP